MINFILFFACSGAIDIKDTSEDTAFIEEPSEEPTSEPTGEPTSEPSSESENNVSDVVINEVLAKSDSTDDWIELYNSGTLQVDLSGLGLVDDIETDEPWFFPEGTVLSAGGYVLIWVSLL